MTDAEYNRKYFSSFKLKKMKIPKAVKKVNKAIAKAYNKLMKLNHGFTIGEIINKCAKEKK